MFWSDMTDENISVSEKDDNASSGAQFGKADNEANQQNSHSDRDISSSDTNEKSFK